MRSSSQASRNASQNKLLNTLLLNGKVSAKVIDEVAALLEVNGPKGRADSDSNISRKWQRAVRRDVHMPGLYYADLDLKGGRRPHPFRLPSVKARELWDRDPNFFNLEGTQDLLGRVETSENWRQHPLFKEAGLDAKPVTFYGDSIPYVANKHGKQGSLMCLFYSFPHRLPRDGSEQIGNFKDGAHSWMDDIHVFTVIRKEDLTKNTMNEMWDVLAWDMEGMLEGVFPTERHDERLSKTQTSI